MKIRAASAFKVNRDVAILLVALLLFPQAVLGAVSNETISDELATLPPCAILCFTNKCELSNTTCICEMEAHASTEDCLLDTCALPEALFSNNVTKTACQVPVRDQTVKFNIMCLTLGLLAGATVAIRLIFKQFFSGRQSLDTDDWIIFATLPLGLTCITLEVVGLTANGLGRDLWGLPKLKLLAFGRYFYIIQILYLMIIGLIKLTLCFFYLKIFRGQIIRGLLWAMVVFHVLFPMGFAIGVVFQCTPIPYQWDRYNWDNGPDAPGSQGHCININAAGWGHGAVNIASDFFLLGIPLSQIGKLKLHWKKKVGVSLMFLTGAIVTIVSFLRLRSIPRYAKTINPTWDQWDVVYWSTVEVCVGLICTSLPAMRLVLLRIAPRVFGSDSRHRRPSVPRAAEPSPHVESTLPSTCDNKRALDSSAISLYSQPDTTQSQSKTVESQSSV
ncbi:hypothetical protein QQS21_002558 [Conoideocrella luteorostrata]|uniref:Rhodopsin domain-containing protein n=1 Tax=Conoideocrella luteorostrata TaxID=1105319 RepID=A0AAJ0CXP0_9HYPO|nr:hypothetical protein QQS21_002558 [Conoideocrella luteorostrata]